MLSDLLPLLKAYFFDSTMDKTLEGKTYLEYLVEQTNLPMISVRDCVNDHFVEYSNFLEQTFQIRIYSTTVRKEEWAIHSRLVNDISSTLQNYDLEMITGGMANVGIAEENEGGLSDEAYAAQLQQWIDEGTVLRDIERREKGWTFDAIIHNIPNGQTVRSCLANKYKNPNFGYKEHVVHYSIKLHYLRQYLENRGGFIENAKYKIGPEGVQFKAYPLKTYLLSSLDTPTPTDIQKMKLSAMYEIENIRVWRKQNHIKGAPPTENLW
jgi:hypothetical protein